jgi:hypothetical protein
MQREGTVQNGVVVLDSAHQLPDGTRVEVMVRDEQRFRNLASAWKAETKFLSNITNKVMHPAYQKIIGMGESSVPLILEDLADNGPNDWFWALTAITDENPITKEIAGNMAAMTEAWLQWGKKAGYLKDCRKKTSDFSQT